LPEKEEKNRLNSIFQFWQKEKTAVVRVKVSKNCQINKE